MMLALVHIIGPPPARPSEDVGRHRTVRYSFILENETYQPKHNVQLWTYVPLENTPFQKNLQVSSGDNIDFEQDAEGNRIAHFTIDTIPPRGSRQIRVTAETAHFSDPQPSIIDDDKHIMPQPLVESTHPEITALAGKLMRDSDKKTAKAIFNWVVGNLEYTGYLKSDRGALYALRNKYGDCTEFTSLFVALCRASGIPARFVAGYALRPGTALDPASYHSWAEIKLDEKWVLVDPLNKNFAKGAENYLALNTFSIDKQNNLKGAHRYRCDTEGVNVVMK
jgi:transglutaminase-like putative cysteine protease